MTATLTITNTTIEATPELATYDERVARAARVYLARQDRAQHPDGRCDNGGRWYPTAYEQQACCGAVRNPSRAWPWSLMTHCRSMQHVATLHGVEALDVRRAVRRIRGGAN